MALSAELREIAALAGAEAAHRGHEEAGPADLLTALYVWDERVDGPLRKSTGVTARLLRPRAAGGGRRRGQMVPLSSEAADLFARSVTPQDLVRLLLGRPELSALVRDAGGDPGSAMAAELPPAMVCPGCCRPLADGLESRTLRTSVDGHPATFVALVCPGCERVISLGRGEPARRRMLGL